MQRDWLEGIEVKALQGGDAVVAIHRPSSREKLFFLLSGIVSSVPLTLFIYQYADSLLSSLPSSFVVIFSVLVLSPFVEEFAKAFPLLYRHGETERSIFTLGLFVGFGFGFAEFLLYVFVLGVPFFYRLGGIVFHTASTSITTYGIATRRAGLFYLTSVALHFSNNFFALVFASVDPLSLFGPWSLGSYAVMAATLFLSLRLYKKASDRIAG